MKKNLLRLLAVLATLGLIFNIVQIIIILNGGYNRNPAITPEWLQSLDAIGLTLIFAILSIAIIFGAGLQLRGNPKA